MRRRALACSATDLLFSAAFDFEVAGWDVGTEYVQMRLVGHRASLVGVAIVEHETERALSGDADGVFKLWDIRRELGARGLCIQSFTAQMGLTIVKPRTLAAAWDGGRSLVIGSSKLSVFESAFVGSTEDEEVTLATAFSARAGLLLHCALDKIALFDARTGAIVQRLDHLLEHGSSDVTALAADPQMRKLFLGDQHGLVCAFALAHGRLVGTYERDRSRREVSFLRYVEADDALVAVVDRGLSVLDARVNGAARRANDLRLPTFRRMHDAHEQKSRPSRSRARSRSSRPRAPAARCACGTSRRCGSTTCASASPTTRSRSRCSSRTPCCSSRPPTRA